MAVTRQSINIEYAKLASRVGHLFFKKDGVVDQAYAANVVWRECFRRFRKMEHGGGNLILWPVDLEIDSTEGSYKGYDMLNIQPPDTETVGQIDTAEYWRPISMSFRERDKVRGDRAVKQHMSLEFDKAMKGIFHDLDIHMVLDGTGNSGKRIQGLALWTATDPTSGAAAPGGISQALNANWRNQFKDNANSSANFLPNLRELVTLCTSGPDGPKFGLCNRKFRDTLEGKMSDSFLHNPIVTGEMMKKGDPAIGVVFYRSMPIFEDELWTQYGTASGLSQCVFLKPESFIIWNASQKASTRNLVEFIEPDRLKQQTAESGGLRVHIGVMNVERRRNGVFFNGFNES